MKKRSGVKSASLKTKIKKKFSGETPLIFELKSKKF